MPIYEASIKIEEDITGETKIKSVEGDKELVALIKKILREGL